MIKPYYDSLFHIPKTSIHYSNIAQDLRVFGKGFQDSPIIVDCWEESKNYWAVPIPYGLKRFSNAECRTPNKFFDWNCKPNFKWFNNQEEVVNKVINYLPTGIRCRIDAETGFGKSLTALEIARNLNKNCLIIAHKDFILKQFEETLIDLYGIKAGWFHGKKREIHGPVTLTTIQTLNSRASELDEEFLNNFGLVIWDEAHYMGAESYLKIIKMLNCDYCLGLTATWRRRDKLNKVFDVFLGEIVAKGVITGHTIKKLLWAPKLNTNLNFRSFTDRYGNVSRTKIDEAISEDPYCNQFILETTPLVLKMKRRPIIVSNRLEHLDWLYDQMTAMGISVGVFAGKFKGKIQKNDQLREAASKSVLLATPKKVSEGLDLRRYLGKDEYDKLQPLDTIILSPATKDPEQVCGRIGRYLHGPDPLYIHPVPQTQLLMSYFNDACKVYYNRSDVKVKHINSLLEAKK